KTVLLVAEDICACESGTRDYSKEVGGKDKRLSQAAAEVRIKGAAPARCTWQSCAGRQRQAHSGERNNVGRFPYRPVGDWPWHAQRRRAGRISGNGRNGSAVVAARGG